MIHELKVDENHFEGLLSGDKTFEVRKNDRRFEVGDFLALNEIDCIGEYTERFVIMKITYILNDHNYCKENYIIMSLAKCNVELC